jgi:transcriptional regulator with XRE-family HTH domain
MQKTLKELREASGLTQLEVAYKLGVTPQTVYMWESGRREPLARIFVKLARLYGVSPFDIALPEPEETRGKVAA